MRFCRIAVPILSLACPLSGAADDEATMQLSVRPKLCVADSRNRACDMSLTVTWESLNRGYFCLYNEFQGAALICWNDDASGSFAEDRSVAESFNYWMAGRNVEIRLAEAEVEVLYLDSSDRRRNRRRRHAWSVL